jgi:hypothetical protein
MLTTCQYLLPLLALLNHESHHTIPAHPTYQVTKQFHKLYPPLWKQPDEPSRKETKYAFLCLEEVRSGYIIHSLRARLVGL